MNDVTDTAGTTDDVAGGHRPLRILLTIHHDKEPDAGAPGVTLALAEHYRRLGHHAEVLGLDDLPVRANNVLDLVAFQALVARRAAPLLRGGRLDVLDASTGDAWAVAGPLARRSRAILATRSHGLEHAGHKLLLGQPGATTWKYPLYRGSVLLKQIQWSLRHADLSLFLNAEDRAVAVDELGVDPARAHVVRNGIPDYFFDARTEAAAGPRRLAFVGTFDHRKGADVLARVAEELLGVLPGATLSLLGTGKSAAEVVAAFHPSVRGRLTVVPRYRRTELPGLLAGHQLLLFPSRFEGLPGALLEALACGLVPVCSDIPGTRTVLGGTGAGALVPVGDAPAMVHASLGLLGDPVRLASARRRGRALAAGYRWADVAAEQINLYRQALQARAQQDRCNTSALG